MDAKIHIIDEMMGVGKTTSAINLINDADPNTKFMFITPYLDEADRILAACASKDFKEPELFKGSKTNDLKRLLKNGENIASTHELFYKMDAECLELIESYEYTLVVDEILTVVKTLEITPYDLEMVVNLHTVNENGFLRWTTENYKGVLEKYKNLCELNCVFIYGEGSAMLWMFPAEVFKSFKNVYLLTYMFDGQIQKAYFDFNKVEYDYMYVGKDYRITDKPCVHDIIDYKGLVLVLDNEKMNRIGFPRTALSSKWYEKHPDTFDVIKKNTYNYFKRYAQTNGTQSLWTTFEDYQDDIAPSGYAMSFKALNTRSTNILRHKTSVAYLVNRFMQPIIYNFFVHNHIEVNEERFALAEMVQFVWRSAIRDGKPIQVYIPSRRMRELFTTWLDNLGGNT